MNIYHIIPEADWRNAMEEGSYQPSSMKQEGFIHFSKLEQVVDTAHRYYQGRTDLLLLQVDPDKVVVEVKYENTHGGEELFPHLYGPLTLDAVLAVYPFPHDETGAFALPQQIHA